MTLRIRKIIILLLISLLSFLSIFFSFLTTLPLAILSQELKKTGYLLAIIGALVVLYGYAAWSSLQFLALAIPFVSFAFISWTVAYVMFSENKAWKNLWKLQIPAIFILLISILVTYVKIGQQQMQSFIMVLLKNNPILQHQIETLRTDGSAESIALLQFLENQEMMAREILVSVPGYLLSFYVIMIWLTVYMLHRFEIFVNIRQLMGTKMSESSILAKKILRKKFNERMIGQYKNPFWMLYGVVLALTISLIEIPINDASHLFLLQTLTHCFISLLMVFYFFQGFGVFLHLLNFWGISGLFRSIMVLTIFLLAIWIIPFLGLIDVWVDFRNRFKISPDQSTNITT